MVYQIRGWLEIKVDNWWPQFKIDAMMTSPRDDVTSRLFGYPNLTSETIAHDRKAPDDAGSNTAYEIQRMSAKRAQRCKNLTWISFQEMLGLYHHTKHCGFAWFNLVQIMRLYGNKLGHENVRLVVWFEKKA